MIELTMLRGNQLHLSRHFDHLDIRNFSMDEAHASDITTDYLPDSFRR